MTDTASIRKSAWVGVRYVDLMRRPTTPRHADSGHRERIHIRTATVADPVGDPREEWQAQRTRIEAWWPKLDPTTQEWLIANNEDVVPSTVLGQITEAGGDVTSDASSIGDNGPGGFLLSDATVDWTEETANYETDSDAWPGTRFPAAGSLVGLSQERVTPGG